KSCLAPCRTLEPLVVSRRLPELEVLLKLQWLVVHPAFAESSSALEKVDFQRSELVPDVYRRPRRRPWPVLARPRQLLLFSQLHHAKRAWVLLEGIRAWGPICLPMLH